ncbi:metal ABC transporter solute-binding protein, Zn/Mn family [Corynebacterium cystitidis]|uniref:Zinc/manganese transport system substrate-binding protein n=1 Tax=Corynebacterium cystitidis DSM 20524 TaxID=1121357 RepID=A0A1H9W8S5_9CORY|nr:zinc ABC transporter substrate-binding protein [Corynebacterium cystitidis]WJY83271.1 high-affinity zinc transporter periplasmic component [Corynebacterium cystitidis DSM 20524]SES30224.1 zinc/manganese transport system substrate-binding protein [Corynebacterium cystitidis DSM 20524]SNV64054.1 ABC transporter, solute-binding protein [Corynebacterium cystitidis]
MKMMRTVFAAFAASTLAFAAGCTTEETTGTDTTAASSENGTEDGSEDGLSIVASTSIWGDVASAVVTDQDAEITAIISGNSVDPHHFEPAAADLAKAAEADIVVVGGGGYDAWLYEVVDEEKIVHALPLIAHSHDHDHGDHDHDHAHDHGDHDHAHDHGDHDHAHDHGDHDHAHDHGDHDHDHAHDHGDHEGPIKMIDGNEHIWYDTDAVEYVAEEIEAAAKAIDPEIEADAQPVIDRMGEMDELIADLPAANVTQSESVGDYIIHDSELTDITPESYRKAILSHSEPAAADLAAFLDTLENEPVDLLIFNPQTATDTSQRIHDAAEEKDIPIVEIAETPEEGVNFLDYFEDRVNALAEAAKA